MTVVADAGPLMALAKVGGLDSLLKLFPEILTPPAVFAEAVTAGLHRGDPDARELDARYEAGHLLVVSPKVSLQKSAPLLGLGERQAIGLALERGVEWLLVDDAAARRSAEEAFRSAGADIRIKGSLGVVISARLQGLLSSKAALGLVERMERRPDIWVSRDLCRRVAELLISS